MASTTSLRGDVFIYITPGPIINQLSTVWHDLYAARTHIHACLYFDLPVQLFADPYELDHPRGSYTFERFGVGNLEAPVFAVGAGDPSGLLSNVTVPEGDEGESHQDDDILSIKVPLHARQFLILRTFILYQLAT